MNSSVQVKWRSVFGYRIVLIYWMFLLGINGISQTMDDLKMQEKNTRDEIALTTKLLEETKSGKTETLNQLLLIKQRIKFQENLITNIHQEINIYENNIKKRKELIEAREKEIKLLKDEYARIIYSAYKNKHNSNKWLFIFSSEDFNQAYRRLKYLEQYSGYRKEQVEKIKQAEENLKVEMDSMIVLKSGKETLLNQMESEKRELLNQKNQESSTYSQLQKREKDLKRELQQKEKIAKQIKKTINKIIEEEKRKALEKNKNKVFALTPEEQKLSNSFEKNRGGLPWPTERGIITGRYGEQPHPVLKGIKIFNSGIDISTVEGSTVRALFDGEVRDVWSIQGRNMAVIIKHGEYFTVYQNLVDVTVKPGDKVSTKEQIGRIYTDKQDGNRTVLHLEIWKGSNRSDPYEWLAK